MDANKIFGLFTNNDNPNPPINDGGGVETLVDFKEHTVFWVGMFRKLIHNHKEFNTQVLEFYSKMDEELDIYDVEVAGEFVVYNRAWFWISKLDIQTRMCQEALLHYADKHLVTYLKFSISYWEEYEEYEKCAHLKKLLDFIS